MTDKIRIIGMLAACLLMITGCSSSASYSAGGLKVIMTCGFAEDEVLRIEDLSCSMQELKVYLINMREEYQAGLGEKIWTIGDGDESLSARLKDACLSGVIRVKTMVLLARKNGIELDDREIGAAHSAAEAYYESLTEEDITAMAGVSEDVIYEMFLENALASKLYEYTIRDINPEVSDDEARTITVLQIMRYTTGADGVSLSDSEVDHIRKDMESVKKQIEEGADFESFVADMNEAPEGTISFGKGEVDKALEDAAFNLSTGEVSDVIRTGDGLVLLKCVTTFNREETEANKVRIALQRKSEAFSEEYDAFAGGLACDLNEELWNSVRVEDGSVEELSDFFDVFNTYFGED
ncbi:peptidylprolyl isomerase [Butyrivibrio sp. MC2013]|uniref:peptidylprolyl isomerase n=1 Tax=Butyrivibrio sp. MC2013 TaxID=1280686 RepID=UPI00042181CB|nr:peptidylprolyl isomerase [Butyrivibrio sp. MC2013]